MASSCWPTDETVAQDGLPFDISHLHCRPLRVASVASRRVAGCKCGAGWSEAGVKLAGLTSTRRSWPDVDAACMSCHKTREAGAERGEARLTLFMCGVVLRRWCYARTRKKSHGHCKATPARTCSHTPPPGACSPMTCLSSLACCCFRCCYCCCCCCCRSCHLASSSSRPPLK